MLLTLWKAWLTFTRAANFGLLSISHRFKRVEVWGMPE
jgi:hypothetical protein